MPAETPTGPISLSIADLRTLVSESSTFQAWTDTGSAAAALVRVYVFEQSELKRPFAWIGFPMNATWAMLRHEQSSADTFDAEGEMLIGFEGEVDESTEQASELQTQLDRLYKFTNNIGAIIKEICNPSGVGGKLQILNVRVVRGPQRNDFNEKNSRGTFFQMVLAVRWKGVV